MSEAVPVMAGISAASPWWRRWREPAVRMCSVDILAAAVAFSLPWSTSATGILMVLWFAALVPTLRWQELKQTLLRPAAALPLAFAALAIIGTLWGDAAWPARLHGTNPLAKLIAIPFLIYHFQRSSRGHWVFIAFLGACSALLALSFVVALVPFTPVSKLSTGVPVKNYIDQSQEFALCLFVLALPLLRFVQARRWGLAAACAVLMLAFFGNMMFVVSARTALVYMPVMLGLFAFLHLSRRAMTLVLLAAVAIATAVWFSSPYLRQRVGDIALEYGAYDRTGVVRSTDERLEYWRKSLRFIADAPLIGHGTGSTKELFEHDAVGRVGLHAVVIANPHNQTLNVAVQWGLIGVVLLYAMWISHLALFRRGGNDLSAWIGLLVVVQNMVSSLLNSHLFDFHEGWMYVLGVGVAGGMVLRQMTGRVAAQPVGAAAGGDGLVFSELADNRR